MIDDYEFSRFPPLMKPSWEIVPEAISADSLCCPRERVVKYSGIKEETYVPDFRPDPSILSELGLRDTELIVTVRPPPTEAHYHNAASEALFVHFMSFVQRRPDVTVVLLPRNKSQEAQIKKQWPHWFSHSKIIVPDKAVDGLNLLWYSDVVVSGGGTMNREAAALGVPVYSIFRGAIGAVDKYLAREGRLVLIESADDIQNKIVLKRRAKAGVPDKKPLKALNEIVSHVENIIRLHYPD
jgi:predicted glycosyltransferase